MGQFFEEIPDNLIAWIQKQRVFWVASAPLDADGHVNVSPKGVEGTFHIKDSNTVWYEDLTGSGKQNSLPKHRLLTCGRRDRYRDHFAYAGKWESDHSVQRIGRCPKDCQAVRKRLVHIQ